MEYTKLLFCLIRSCRFVINDKLKWAVKYAIKFNCCARTPNQINLDILRRPSTPSLVYGKVTILYSVLSLFVMFCILACSHTAIGELASTNLTQQPTKTTLPSNTMHGGITISDQKANETSGFPLSLVDSAGNNVTLAQIPTKIVAYDASAVEILFAIGKDQNIAGTHSFVTFPPETKGIPKLGDAFSLDVEAILNLDPDLVYIFFPSFVEQLENAGLKVLYLESLNANFREMTDRFRMWGKIVDAQHEAEVLAKDFEDRVRKIESVLATQPEGPSVFWDTFQLYTPSDDTLIGEVLSLLKLQNIAFDVSISFEQFSPELIIARNPEIIFSADPLFFTSNPMYNDVSAVANGAILPPDDRLSIDGPRFIDGIESLANTVYPELFPKASTR